MGTPTCTFDRASIEQNELAKQLYYPLFNETKVSCEEMDVGYPILNGTVDESGTLTLGSTVKIQGAGDGVVEGGEVVEYALKNYQKFKDVLTKGVDKNLMAQALLTRGVFAVQMHQNDVAIKYFDQSLQLNPQDPVVYYNRGHYWEDQGNSNQAIADYSKAIDIDPQYIPPFINRGNIEKNNSNLDQAIADYTKAIEINPNFVTAYYDRGLVWEIKDNIDLAIADFLKVTELSPQDAEAYNHLGVNLVKKHMFDKGIEAYSQAINISPQNDEYYTNRGIAWSDKEDINQAISDFTNALTLNPNSSDAYYNRGVCFSKKNELDKAISDYTEAIRINPQSASEAYYNRGHAFGSKKNYDKAISDFTQAIELNPDYMEAYVNRGLYLSTIGKWDEAISDFLAAANIDQNANKPHKSLAFAYTVKEKFQLAVQELGFYFKLSQTNEDTAYHLAKVLTFEWNKSESQKAKMNQFEKDTGGFDMAKVEAQFICAYAYWEAGQKDNAKQILIGLDSAIQFKTPPSALTKHFFNEMFALMPADMAQDEEVKKVLGSLKGKVK